MIATAHSSIRVRQWLLLAACAIGIAYTSCNWTTARGDEPPAQSFYGPDPAANAVREYIYSATRAFLVARGRDFIWTSGYRPGTGTALASRAHAEGAIDYRAYDISSAQRHEEGKALSKSLGPNFTVLVEETYIPGRTPGGLLYIAPIHVMTTYINGQQGRTRFHSPLAGQNTHIHVQHSAGKTPAGLVQEYGLTPTYGSLQRLSELTGPTFFGLLPSPTNANSIAQLAGPPFNFPAPVRDTILSASLAGNTSQGQGTIGGAGWLVPIPPLVGNPPPNIVISISPFGQ
jgi:hypothetical protein